MIRDQGSKIREGIDKQYFRVAYLQRKMAVGIGGDGHEFGLRPADLHPHKVGFFLKYHQSFLEHDARTANAPPDILLQDEIIVLIDKVIYRFVPPHNFDQFFIHDCFELHDEYFQEYPLVAYVQRFRLLYVNFQSVSGKQPVPLLQCLL